MIFGQQLRLSSEFLTVMQTAPNNLLYILQNRQTCVDQELQNTTKILARNDGYKLILAMHSSGP